MFIRYTRITRLLGWIAVATVVAWAGAGPSRAMEHAGTLMGAIGTKLAVASGHATTLTEEINHLGVDSGLLTESENSNPAEDLDAYEREHGLPEKRSETVSTGPTQGGGFPAGGSASMPPHWRDGQGRVTPSMRSSLQGIEAAMTDAGTLANGNEFLAPGIAHVLTNVRRLGAGKTLPANAVSLTNEIEIELFALGNNALILEAEDDLRAASAAMAHGRPEQARGLLEAAAGALDRANERGAYHVFDDRQTLAALLKDMNRDDGDAAPEVSRPVIARLITDIHEHLSDLGGE
jgi:hypothetical protein